MASERGPTVWDFALYLWRLSRPEVWYFALVPMFVGYVLASRELFPSLSLILAFLQDASG